MHAFCAAIEGILWMLQCDLLSLATQELSNSQRAILREKPHTLRKNGNGKLGRILSKVNLKQRVQVSAAIVAALRPNCEIQFDAAGWRDLLTTLDVRDRLGHPEKESDLDVTDAELEAARIGKIWFLDNIIAVVQAEPRAVRENGSSTRSVRSTELLPHSPAAAFVDDARRPRVDTRAALGFFGPE
jgi:hypothetical protein